MRLAATCALLGLAGCDVVFGIGGLGPLPADAPPDGAAPFQIGGRLHLHHTINQGDFTPAAVDDVYAATDLTLAVVLDDGSTPAVTYTADGTFGFTLATPGQAYRLSVTTPLGSIEYESAAPHLEIADHYGGRMDAAPVTQPTLLHFALGSPLGAVFLTSTGVWTQTYTNQVNTAMFDFDWKAALPQTGLLRTDVYDRLYFTDIGSYPQAAPTYNAIYGYRAYSVMQTNGMTTTISAPPIVTITHDTCTHLIALRNVAFNRLRTALPGYPTWGDTWTVFALPSYESADAGNVWVAIAGDGPTPTDVNLNVTYINPFVGTKLIAAMDVVLTRTEQLPGTTTGVAVAAGGRTRVPVTATAGCSPTATVLTSTIGIASLPKLDGTLLDADNKQLALDRATDVIATWSTASAGPVDYASVALIELTNAAGATKLVNRHNIVTPGTSATFARSLFESGHTYLIQINNWTGAPNAAAGDFDTIGYPRSNNVTMSYSFLVTN